MDDFATAVGYGLIETVATIALTLALLWLMVRSSQFARWSKITFLACWGFAVTGLPVIGAALASGTDHAIPSLIGCTGIVLFGGVSYFYLGWPALRRELFGSH